MADDPPPIRFPAVRWADPPRDVTFVPWPAPARPSATVAVIVFAWQNGAFILANVRGRGWCVPSGHIEPGETPAQAAARETHEEIGAELLRAREIGHYVLTSETSGRANVAVFVGQVASHGAIPAGSESLGSRAVSPGDIAVCYYRWDELIAAVFAYAEQELRRNP